MFRKALLSSNHLRLASSILSFFFLASTCPIPRGLPDRVGSPRTESMLGDTTCLEASTGTQMADKVIGSIVCIRVLLLPNATLTTCMHIPLTWRMSFARTIDVQSAYQREACVPFLARSVVVRTLRREQGSEEHMAMHGTCRIPLFCYSADLHSYRGKVMGRMVLQQRDRSSRGRGSWWADSSLPRLRPGISEAIMAESGRR